VWKHYKEGWVLDLEREFVTVRVVAGNVYPCSDAKFHEMLLASKFRWNFRRNVRWKFHRISVKYQETRQTRSHGKLFKYFEIRRNQEDAAKIKDLFGRRWSVSHYFITPPWLLPISTRLLDGDHPSPCHTGLHWIHCQLLPFTATANWVASQPFDRFRWNEVSRIWGIIGMNISDMALSNA